MTLSPPIIVASEDRERLRRLLEQHPTSDLTEQLEGELDRASVVPWQDVPPDVVTMNSELEYEDVASGQRRRLRLVYPSEADTGAGRISVLAPLGCAQLGLHVAQEIDLRMPRGPRRHRVLSVAHPSGKPLALWA
jgi:regulator of nucleoside diphosphate kinase